MAKSDGKSGVQSTCTRFYHLYENEIDSDITLMVGEEGLQERIPGHSWVLSLGSDYFRALFHGPLSRAEKIYSFPDNPKGFNNLVRWLYQNKCELPSLQSSLETLSVAIKYLCPELVEHCIMKMVFQLDEKNVLNVLEWIYCYCSHFNPQVPSAPPLEDLQNTNSSSLMAPQDFYAQDPTASCHHLLNECLELIDKKTDDVLSSEHLVSVDSAILKLILQRNSLKLSSELVAAEALYRWSTAECKRQHFPLTPESRRRVLGILVHQLRLLSMSSSEFSKFASCPHLCSLYEEDELSWMGATVKRIKPPTLPSRLDPHVKLMATPRQSPSLDNASQLLSLKDKKKSKKKFNKKEIILDLVSLLSMIFD